MKLSPQQLAKVLVDGCEGREGRALQNTIQQFVTFLADEGYIDQWRSIERSIHQEWKKKYGASKLTIVSAFPLMPKTQKHIEALARGADIVQRVDERLIGGAVIRIDDTRIDGSITGALRRLKTTLAN